MYGAKVKLFCGVTTTMPSGSPAAVREAWASAVPIGEDYILIPETTMTRAQVATLASSNSPIISGNNPDSTRIGNLTARIPDYFSGKVYYMSSFTDAFHNAWTGLLANSRDMTALLPLQTGKYVILFMDSGGDRMYFLAWGYYSGSSYPYNAGNWAGFFF